MNEAMEMNAKICLDSNAIQKLDSLGGSKLVLKMIELFCKNGEEKIAQALEAWDQNDMRTIERMAHSLVSSSGNLGAIRMQKIASQIERNASKLETGDFPSLLHELKAAYEQVRIRLDDVKKRYTQ